MSGFDRPEAAPRLLGAVTVVLTAAAGALDAVTFFAFNEVFASTMTGNLVLLGLDVGRGNWLGTAEALCAIGGYVVGLAAGTVVAGLVMRRLPWRNAVGVALTVELALLVLVGAGWYGLSDPDTQTMRAILMVAGGAAAMGVQAAALRYVGPTGTPTNFLTGTVTNWVSAMVELHKPRWDGNSALRIVVIAVAAGAGAVIQLNAPALTYALPVLLVLIAILLMARVTRLNHGGLVEGGPEFAHAPEPDDDEELRAVVGRVHGPDGHGTQAVLTLVGPDGNQVGREETDHEGRYRLHAPSPGVFTLLCLPVDGPPRVATVALESGTTVYDVKSTHALDA
ncbi:YoaK family protein [Pseudonocardia nematodicida]|uniref:YoaK family protein n=1 Tax=Pseudonocardia nematodicida TaxID=1206997 RepID=A0ABV1K994_9PSEU